MKFQRTRFLLGDDYIRRMRRVGWTLVGSLIVQLACTQQKTAIVDDFVVGEAPYDVYKKAVSAVEADGVEIVTNDPANYSFVTQWKESEPQGVLDHFNFPEDPSRFERVRYRYKIRVQDDQDTIHLRINVEGEGFFRGKQSGTDGGSANWVKLKSKGELEKTLAATISE